MIPPLETAQFNIYKSHQFISGKGTIGKEREWDGWTYGIDAPNPIPGTVQLEQKTGWEFDQLLFTSFDQLLFTSGT